MPEEKAAPGARAPAGGQPSAFGASIAPLDSTARQRLSVPESVKTGVVVTDVDVNSKAFDAGIRAGDVIVELGGTKVSSAEQLSQAWQKSTGSVAILLWRGGHSLYVAAKH
jgi:serine protease Do